MALHSARRSLGVAPKNGFGSEELKQAWLSSRLVRSLRLHPEEHPRLSIAHASMALHSAHRSLGVAPKNGFGSEELKQAWLSSRLARSLTY